MNNSLVAKVKAVNMANDYAPKLYEILSRVFTPLVGKAILKADGSLLAKFNKQLPEFPNGSGFGLVVYRFQSSYSLGWIVKSCVNLTTGVSCVYHETPVYVGELSGSTLTRISDPQKLRRDYTVGEIMKKREALEAAKREMSNIKSSLYPFGEYDN